MAPDPVLPMLPKRAEPHLQVTEIFGPTIQGEGSWAGRPTYFIRLFGCDYRCTWCDSFYSVLPEHRLKESTPMTVDTIMRKLKGLPNGPDRVVISGGNPGLFRLSPLVRMLKSEGYQVAVETQGSMQPDWFRDVDLLTISPKGPSSKLALEVLASQFDNVDMCLKIRRQGRTDLKVVLFTLEDLDFLEQLNTKHQMDPYVRVFASVGTVAGASTEILLANWNYWIEKISDNPVFSNVTILPQLHVLLWGHKRGV